MLQAQADARYRERMRQWERDAPVRRAGELAYQGANQRRAAEPGTAGVSQIAACLEWTRPRRPVIG